jgi:Undecaprenyl-phosphate glucose phosphotransferase
MFDKYRTLVASAASGQFGQLYAPTRGRTSVAWASRWGIIAGLQIAEAMVVAVNICFWSVLISSYGGASFNIVGLLAFGIAVAALVHFGLRCLGAYDFVDIMNARRSCKMGAVAWILSTGMLLFVAFITPTAILGRIVIFGWLTGFAGLVSVRLIAAWIANTLVRAGWLRHNVVIIGCGAEAERCSDVLCADGSDANVVGFVSIPHKSLCAHGMSEDVTELLELQRLISANNVKDVIISTSLHEQEELPDLVQSLLWLPVRVYLWPPNLDIRRGFLTWDGYRIGDVPLLLVGVPPLDGWHWVIKDVRDRLLAALLLIFTSPVLLGIVLMIRLTSPGPILFKQPREGYGGTMFTIFKFRTMRTTSDPKSILNLTIRNDPRVYPVGALLRRTSLDELPQLLNVLRGDMWLVGPRPHSPLATADGQRYSAAVSGYISRLRVKPGITGWAQVNGWRGPTNTREQIQQRFLYDLQYIQHVSLWFDLRILLQTAVKGFVHKNAY